MLTQAETTSECITPRVTTKRRVISQLTLCQGCCCGNVARGKPEMPVEWIKQQWRSVGLAKSVQLTISGCLGPCDVLNVVRVSSVDDDVWLGNITSFEQFEALVKWALAVKVAGEVVGLPAGLQAQRFNPFCGTSRDSEISTNVSQTRERDGVA